MYQYQDTEDMSKKIKKYALRECVVELRVWDVQT
jgi:hypothetical protein